MERDRWHRAHRVSAAATAATARSSRNHPSHSIVTAALERACCPSVRRQRQLTSTRTRSVAWNISGNGFSFSNRSRRMMRVRPNISPTERYARYAAVACIMKSCGPMGRSTTRDDCLRGTSIDSQFAVLPLEHGHAPSIIHYPYTMVHAPSLTHHGHQHTQQAHGLPAPIDGNIGHTTAGESRATLNLER